MNHTGRVCDKLEPRIQLNTFIGWLAKLRKSTTCWKTLGWTTKLCRCSTQNLKFLRLVLFVSWMAGVYGDACSADRQALVGSGRQSAGSCYLSELSRLHLERWAPVENKLATHQEAASSQGRPLQQTQCKVVWLQVRCGDCYILYFTLHLGEEQILSVVDE